MTTQNLHTALPRSSGHKEPTLEHATTARLDSQGEGGDPKALLNRLLTSRVSRASLFDQDDFLCVASKRPFDIEPDQVRKVLDGLLTFSRQGDPTFASGDGHPPTRLHIGKDVAEVKRGTPDCILATLNGKPFVAARTATYVVLVEGPEDANEESLVTDVRSFQEGLEQLTL